LNARAREYFQHQDEEGLKRLIASLEEHRDTEQVNKFAPLIRGYLAELCNDNTAALSAYQEITDGPAQIDALMRLFGLHTNNRDLDSALETLRILSHISPVYTPMYADMLQGTGNIETAVEIYTDYILANPDDVNSVMKLGKIYHEHGSTEGVEWAMNYILGKDPDNQTARAMLKSLNQTQSNDQ